MTSGLPRLADMYGAGRHVRKVPPVPEVATSVAPSQAEHRSVAWLGGQASYWHIATRATAKTAHHDHVRPSRNRHLPEISRLSSVLTQDRHVGRFTGFQGLPRVGGQGDGYQKLIAVIVAVCGYRL